MFAYWFHGFNFWCGISFHYLVFPATISPLIISYIFYYTVLIHFQIQHHYLYWPSLFASDLACPVVIELGPAKSFHRLSKFNLEVGFVYFHSCHPPTFFPRRLYLDRIFRISMNYFEHYQADHHYYDRFIRQPLIKFDRIYWDFVFQNWPLRRWVPWLPQGRCSLILQLAQDPLSVNNWIVLLVPIPWSSKLMLPIPPTFLALQADLQPRSYLRLQGCSN